MSQLPYINETHKQEHEHEARAKRSLMIGYDSDNLQYNKLKVNADGSILLSGIGLPPYDAVLVTYPDTVTEVYALKTGGLSGTTIATLTVIYTDATKEKLLSVEKI